MKLQKFIKDLTRMIINCTFIINQTFYSQILNILKTIKAALTFNQEVFIDKAFS